MSNPASRVASLNRKGMPTNMENKVKLLTRMASLIGDMMKRLRQKKVVWLSNVPKLQVLMVIFN